jgi:hypothetical protein
MLAGIIQLSTGQLCHSVKRAFKFPLTKTIDVRSCRLCAAVRAVREAARPGIGRAVTGRKGVMSVS